MSTRSAAPDTTAEHDVDGDRGDGPRRPPSDDRRDSVFLLDLAPHEFGAFLTFEEYDLTPYWAFTDALKRLPDSEFADGPPERTVDVDGVEFTFRLTYHESGFAPRPSDDIETVREFDLHFEADDDVGERSGSFNISPRWPDMKLRDGGTAQMPDMTGVEIQAQGSNLEPETYPKLLRAAASAFGVEPGYFENPSDKSRVYELERYARIDRERAKQVIGRNGPLRRIFEYVESGGSIRELREDDTETFGFHHRVGVGSDGAGELVDGHEHAKRAKMYHPKHPRDDPDDPLYHPKLGVRLWKGENDDGAVPWDDVAELDRELDEFLLNVLGWAGLPTRADSEVYVSDEYFEVRERPRPRKLVDDPTPNIKREQTARVVDGLTMNPDLTKADVQTVQVLADGGSMEIPNVAEAAQVSKRTVYNVVDRLGDLLENDGGVIGFASEYLADAVRTAVGEAKEAIQKDDGANRTPFERWKNAYGVEVSDEDGRLQLRFGRVPFEEHREMMEALRGGLDAWVKAGRPARRFGFARVEWKDADGRPNVRERACPEKAQLVAKQQRRG